MRLRVVLPERVAVDQQVTKVIAEGADGVFCLLPKHVDFAAALVPGLLSFTSEANEQTYLALDQGTLVKCADDVLVSTRQAILDRPLGQLRRAVDEELRHRDQRQERAQAALAKIEVDLVRRLTELSAAER